MMYIFGGEFSNPSLTQYRHYRDLWRLDLEDMSWERIELRGGPSGRSGHRMCVANNRLIVFGGFFDTGFENKYLNDLYYIDLTLDELKWVKVETSAVDIVPSRRSGFQWVVYGTDVVLYGGYCKETVKKAKTVSHKGKKKGSAAIEESMVSQGMVLSDIYKLSAVNMKWSKMKRSGYGPARRAGFSMILHKSNAVVFGGVEDDETEENIASVFYNDLFALNLEKKKWHPMTLRRKKTKKGRRRKGRENETVTETERRSEANPAPDGDLEMVDVDDFQIQEQEEEKELDTDTLEAALMSERSEVLPCPRFNAAVAIQKNVLYIMGGVVEKEQQETTLDDIWAIDLNKLDEYKEVKSLSPECLEWMESDGEEEENEDGSDGDDKNDSQQEDVDMGDEEEDEERQRRRGGRRDRLRARVQDTENEHFTPRVNESLKDFFERTKSYWIGEVHEALGESGKALRRVAFEWAFRRYWEIKPTLKELEEIEAQIAHEEALEREFQRVQLEEKRTRGRR
ncbi:Kelch-type beta propeller [Gracilaria domingensis]|nr:Kelch-type beta propeller [Gracilaria domingensis]